MKVSFGSVYHIKTTDNAQKFDLTYRIRENSDAYAFDGASSENGIFVFTGEDEKDFKLMHNILYDYGRDNEYVRSGDIVQSCTALRNAYKQRAISVDLSTINLK